MDSGSLTTGTVLNGSSEDRGSRLALHSIIGFLGGALGGPVVGLAQIALVAKIVNYLGVLVSLL